MIVAERSSCSKQAHPLACSLQPAAPACLSSLASALNPLWPAYEALHPLLRQSHPSLVGCVTLGCAVLVPLPRAGRRQLRHLRPPPCPLSPLPVLNAWRRAQVEKVR